jgi:hypothetical protein
VLGEGGCLLWQGCLDVNGYGRVTHDGKPSYAHRVAYEREVGPIPDGMTIDHLCETKSCVNTTHLEVVTRGENTSRWYRKRAR